MVQAYVWANQYRPDVVLLDLMLPGTDGLNACRELRSRLDTPTRRIVEAHSGVIELASAVGGGTQAVVRLPIAEESAS